MSRGSIDEAAREILSGFSQGGQDYKSEPISNTNPLPITNSLSIEDAAKEILSSQPDFESIKQSLKVHKSPLSFKQNIMFGLMPNDELKQRYLEKELGTGNIQQNEKGEFVADGVRINPKGFDFGDIARSSGGTLQFMSEILGGIGGFSIGNIPGAIAGSGAGAAASEALRFKLASLEGLDSTSQQVWKELTAEGMSGAAGEAIGFGLGKLITRFGRKNTLKALSEIAEKTINGLSPEMAGNVLHFIGSMDADAAAHLVKSYKLNKKIVNPRNLDRNAAGKLAERVIFGREVGSANELLIPGEISKNIGDLLSDAARINDSNFNTFLSEISGGKLTPDLINSVRNIGIGSIQNAPTAGSLSVKTVSAYRALLETVGKDLGSAELSAIKGKATETFSEIIDFEKSLRGIVDSTGIMKPLRQKGFKPTNISIKGANQFNELLSLFKRVPTKSGAKALEKAGIKVKYDEFGNPVSRHFLSEMGNKVSIRDASKIMKKFDLKVDEIISDTKIPSEIRRATAKIANNFRTAFDSRLGIQDLNAKYSVIKEIANEAKIDRAGVLNSFENIIKGFSNVSEARKGPFSSVLNEIQEGDSILKGIEAITAKKQLAKVSSKEMVSFLESKFQSKNILKSSKSNTSERILEEFSNIFKNTKSLSSRKFIEEAKDIAAVNDFMNVSGQNMLRIGTMRNLLGLGALSLAAFGPVGSLAGTAAALGIMHPKTLNAITKKFIQSPRVLRAAARKTPAYATGPVKAGILGKGPEEMLRRALGIE